MASSCGLGSTQTRAVHDEARIGWRFGPCSPTGRDTRLKPGTVRVQIPPGARLHSAVDRCSGVRSVRERLLRKRGSLLMRSARRSEPGHTRGSSRSATDSTKSPRCWPGVQAVSPSKLPLLGAYVRCRAADRGALWLTCTPQRAQARRTKLLSSHTGCSAALG